MAEVLDKKEVYISTKTYKQSRIAYLFYYLITFAFLFLAFYVKWNQIFNIGCFVLFFLFLFYFEILISVNQLIVDDKKVEMRTGFLKHICKSVPLYMISDMHVKQTLLQSIFHYGTLELNTGGGEHYELSMHKLRNPIKVKEDIENRLHKVQFVKKI